MMMRVKKKKKEEQVGKWGLYLYSFGGAKGDYGGGEGRRGR